MFRALRIPGNILIGQMRSNFFGTCKRDKWNKLGFLSWLGKALRPDLTRRENLENFGIKSFKILQNHQIISFNIRKNHISYNKNATYKINQWGTFEQINDPETNCFSHS